AAHTHSHRASGRPAPPRESSLISGPRCRRAASQIRSVGRDVSEPELEPTWVRGPAHRRAVAAAPDAVEGIEIPKILTSAVDLADHARRGDCFRGTRNGLK